jgi:hypothetical protein
VGIWVRAIAISNGISSFLVVHGNEPCSGFSLIKWWISVQSPLGLIIMHDVQFQFLQYSLSPKKKKKVVNRNQNIELLVCVCIYIYNK